MDKDNTSKATLDKAKAGDARAYEQLLRAHYPVVFRAAYHWCGHRQDAEDITQRVCLKLPRILKQFRGQSAFSTWLYRVTINEAKDLAKAKKRRQESTADGLAELACPTANHGDALAISQALQFCLSRLSEVLREAILVVYAQDCTQKEAAILLKSKEGTIAWRISEGKKRLQACLQEQEAT